MALSATQPIPDSTARMWAERLPLYAASLIVTLAGIGAVGVSITATHWTLVWALLAVVGHGVSLALRRWRVAPEQVFYPVMLLGCSLAFQQLLMGTPLSGLDGSVSTMPTDMATAVVVGALAVVRCFTLVSDTALLFSPVPAITMLALVGSSNPNPEVPIFFGLVVLGALFTCGYEAHLRRGERVRRTAGLVTYYLLAAWAMTLAVALAALAAPLAVQPVVAQFSPYALPAMSRMKMMLNFTQANSSQAPVGQGPITLSPTPLFEVYAREGGKLRTTVFSTYTGREWTTDRQPYTVQKENEGRVGMPGEPRSGLDYPQPPAFRFRFPRDPDLAADVPSHRLVERLVTKSMVAPPIPAFGRIRELHYPGATVTVDASGCVSGVGHLSPDRVFDVLSEVPDYTPAQLRAAPRVDPDQFPELETLQLPQSAYRVQALAQRITARFPNPYDQVTAIIGYIERNCRYSLIEDVTPLGEDAATHYLFNSRRGACDLAATASAVMCRSVGIPARVAVGYVAEEALPQGGGFLVRQEHAHMWLEAFFPGCGWVAFDPAPPLASIKDHPLDMFWYKLHEWFSKVGGGGMDAALLLTVIFVTLAMVAYVLITGREPRVRTDGPVVPPRIGREAARVYQRALDLLARRGWSRQVWMTADEYCRAITGEWGAYPEACGALRELTELFDRAYYGEDPSAEVLQEARSALLRLERCAPHRPRDGKRTGSGAPAGSSAAGPA